MHTNLQNKHIHDFPLPKLVQNLSATKFEDPKSRWRVFLLWEKFIKIRCLGTHKL